MGLTQMHLIACALAGGSLAFNICCASNFIDEEEMTTIGYGFYVLHSTCIFAARVSLSSIVLILCMELFLTDGIARYAHINANYFPIYMRNLMIASFLFSIVRFGLPGPVEYFSRFYKLGIFLNLAGIVVVAVDTLLECSAAPLAHADGKSAGSFHVSSSHHSTGSLFEDEDAIEPEDIISITAMQRSSSSETTVKGFIPTKRHRTVMELLQTETSYMRNLNTILKLYKAPLEEAVAAGKPLLAPEDIKTIFGGIKEIAAAHAHLHRDVSKIIDEWTEDCCVANIIKDNKDRLTLAYPPYVNYFDMANELLLKRQETNPAFKEFLIQCFNDPQGLKQTLDALLIRPVQRLPSLLLLITDLRKRTPEHMKDHAKLGDAVEDLKKILSYINEDKRKTEGKMKIFDIVYEVTGCPVEIVSSNRSYIGKVDVTALTDGFYRQGERLALYLLTDVLEIAKWRNRSHGKSLLKHIDLLPLRNILAIMDIADVDDCTNMFAVRYLTTGNGIPEAHVHQNSPPEEKVTVLQLIDDRSFKASWINSFVNQVAHAKGLTHSKKFLSNAKPSDVLNYVKRNTKLYKKLKTKMKVD